MFAAVVDPKVLEGKGFSLARNGFYVPSREYQADSFWVKELEHKGFKPRQVDYIRRVLDNTELGVIGDHLEDALYIGIINSMSRGKLNTFYDTYEALGEHQPLYLNLQVKWMQRSRDLLKSKLEREPTEREFMEHVKDNVSKRFRAYWRMRFPEKTRERKWVALRKK